MCNYKDYTEKDFDMSSSTNLYPEEETDAAIMLSNAVTDGLTLSQICRLKLDVGEAGLNTFSTIRTIIDETYCVLDMEIWFKNLGIDPIASDESTEVSHVDLAFNSVYARSSRKKVIYAKQSPVSFLETGLILYCLLSVS